MVKLHELLILGLVPTAQAWWYQSNGPTATVKNGTVVGTHSSAYNQDFFLGIPYAQPPLGVLRFTNPQSLNSSFAGSLSATQYSPDCVGYGDDVALSEDCLYLNVIRPSNAGRQLPVAVWIYGGGLRGGGTADTYYNLSFIVENSVKIGKPIIAVSFNYRLSGWGFLSSQEVTATGNTNMGIRDQRLALHWIQENIAAFGGDRNKVTIWGESAGALSVGYHLTAYNGRDDGLFRAAIMESGAPINYNTYRVEADYQPTYDALVNVTGCNVIDTLNCLRHAPFDVVNNFFNTTDDGMWNPVPIVDGDLIQKWGSIQLSQGNFVHVPILTGANTDEGTSFPPNNTNTSAEFITYATTDPLMFLPVSIAPEILTAYPETAEYRIPSDQLVGDYQYPGSQFRRVAAFAGDVRIIANRRATCQTWSANGVKAYCYRFNTRTKPYYLGVQHFDEVAFVFDNVDGLGYAGFGLADPFQDKPQSYRDLAFLMSASWVSFVHDLDPGLHWPVYNNKQPQNLVWDANVTGLTFVEDDTFRQSGIQWIIDHALSYKR